MNLNEIVYDVLIEDMNKYLQLDPNCTYVHSLFYYIHSNEELKQKKSFIYNEQIHESLETLERSLLNWLVFAEVEDKTFNENSGLKIFFKGGISLLISKGVYYFEKDNAIFSIIYPERLIYDAFAIYLADIALDIEESKNFQKALKLA